MSIVTGDNVGLQVLELQAGLSVQLSYETLRQWLTWIREIWEESATGLPLLKSGLGAGAWASPVEDDSVLYTVQ